MMEQVVLNLLLARSLAIAAHDFDLVGMDRLARVLHLEGNILDQKSPDLVAEAVRIKVTLFILVSLYPDICPSSTLSDAP